MRKIFILVISIIFIKSYAQITLNPQNIEDIVKEMTLEEKATLLVGGAKAVVIDGIPTGVATRVAGAAGTTRPIDRLGIPGTVLADGPVGLRIDPIRKGTERTFYATGFPVGTLLASSWDTDLVEKVTEAMGNEVLEYGVDVILGPGMNIHRHPLNGRNFEYFSEDPLLSGKIAAAYVRGLQSNGVGTSLKHFAANNQETNRLENDSRVSERALREIYLKNFEIAVKESDPWTVMASYNMLNGDYTQQKRDLLTSVLRDEWGYNGIVMTDWACYDGTVKAVQAGNDLMEPGFQVEIDRIVAAVNNGTLDMGDLDRNVRHILEYIVKTPSFKRYNYNDNPDLKAHAQVARDAAAESIILLKNDNNALPIDIGKKVALYGITSLDFIAGGTGAGHVNKPYVINMIEAMENSGFSLDTTLTNYYKAHNHLKEATAALTNTNLHYWLGDLNTPEIPIPDQAIELEAKNNDIAVIVIGRNAGEGADRMIKNDFELTNIEHDLIRSVSSAFHREGKNVVVILNIGGVIETESWKNIVDAIILPWSPGQEGANAIVDILTAKVNPSGKLPMTFPVNVLDHPSSSNFPLRYSDESNNLTKDKKGKLRKNVDYTNYDEGIYVGYRYFTSANKEVSYPFGYGLSYTNFKYSEPKIKKTKDGFEASINVTNTGQLSGKEIVQLYVSAPEGSLEKPLRELKAFGKTCNLQPGESETLTFKVDNYSLASYNEETSSWETDSGIYKVEFGANVDDIKETINYKLTRPLFWKREKLFQLDLPLNELHLKH